MNQEILKKAQHWINNPAIDQEDKIEIQELIDNNNEKELTERFYKDLEIGTGGIREILGMGINRINKYNIRKATQAMASVLLEEGGKDLKVAIGFDSRRYSDDFAKETAAVFAANGIQAYLYDRLDPVPLLSFSIRYHGAHAGVMVTASHNPPEYNGYKIYWGDGAQVTPPYDKKVIDAYNSIKEYADIKTMSYEDGLKKGLIHLVGDEVENAYFEKLKTKIVNPELCKERGRELKVVYTPIHGTGLVPCMRILKEMGFSNAVTVEAQAAPDWRFPTVKSPNPENPEAMELAVNQMRETGADIVFGTDPDTDRLGVAIMHEGEVFYPNGNQIGLLMLHYILTNLKEQGRMPANPYFVKTVVTTELQATVARKFGLEVENTLTGFKWICGKMNVIEKEQPERNFLFATEESFGYMNHDYVRDKDGVCSVALMAEVALWYKTQGLDLVEALDRIYEEYGFSHETLLSLNYYGKEGAEKIERIMSLFRETYTSEMNGLGIQEVEDYQKSTISSPKEGKTLPIDLPKSNVLGYLFETGDKLYLRPSGTEPKIKFYIMVRENEGDLSQKKQRATQKTENFLSFLKEVAEKA